MAAAPMTMNWPGLQRHCSARIVATCRSGNGIELTRGTHYAASALQRPFSMRTCSRWATGSVRAMSFRSPSE